MKEDEKHINELQSKLKLEKENLETELALQQQLQQDILTKQQKDEALKIEYKEALKDTLPLGYMKIVYVK